MRPSSRPSKHIMPHQSSSPNSDLDFHHTTWYRRSHYKKKHSSRKESTSILPDDASSTDTIEDFPRRTMADVPRNYETPKFSSFRLQQFAETYANSASPRIPINSSRHKILSRSLNAFGSIRSDDDEVRLPRSKSLNGSPAVPEKRVSPQDSHGRAKRTPRHASSSSKQHSLSRSTNRSRTRDRTRGSDTSSTNSTPTKVASPLPTSNPTTLDHRIQHLALWDDARSHTDYVWSTERVSDSLAKLNLFTSRDDSSDDELALSRPPSPPRSPPQKPCGESLTLRARLALDQFQSEQSAHAAAQAKHEALEAARRRPPSIICKVEETARDDLVEAVNDIPSGDIVPGLGAHDFRSVLPSAANHTPWLNDEIVNAYLALQVQQTHSALYPSGQKPRNAPPKFHAFSSFMYPTYRSKGADAIVRWFRRAKLSGEEAVRQAECILIPVNDAAHWTLVAVLGTQRRIEYYDSLGGCGGKLGGNGKRYVDMVVDVLEKVGVDVRGRSDEANTGEEKDAHSNAADDGAWDIGAAESLQQQNCNDCGAFVCVNANALIRGLEPSRSFEPERMNLGRIMIGVELFEAGKRRG